MGFLMPLILVLVTQTLGQGNVIIESKPPASGGLLETLDEPASSSQMPPMEPSLVIHSRSREEMEQFWGKPQGTPTLWLPFEEQGGREAHHRGSGSEGSQASHRPC